MPRPAALHSGKVTYDTALFLQKNTDPLHPDLSELMCDE